MGDQEDEEIASITSGSNFEPNCQKISKGEYNIVDFLPVLATVRLHHLLALCASIRNKGSWSFDDSIEPTEVEKIIYGSYHVLFGVRFRDGLRWLLKLPLCGTEQHFDASASAALQSEALTMRLVREETCVPVPKIIAFSPGFDNKLGCPFILMNFVEGVSLYDFWFDRSGSAGERRTRLSRVLAELATVMASLGSLSFDTGGSLLFDEDGFVTDVGPTRMTHRQSMLQTEAEVDEDADGVPIYFDAGPFLDSSSFYHASISRGKQSEIGIQPSLRKLMLAFLSWIPDDIDGHKGSSSYPASPFVLSHPDFDIQNIIISPKGNLRALIDWDGVAAVPRMIGNEQYPSWLTRDWDPMNYAWTENGDGAEDDDDDDDDDTRTIMDLVEDGEAAIEMLEDYPETLRQHREEYARFMRRAVKLYNPDPPSSSSSLSPLTLMSRPGDADIKTRPNFSPSRTSQSLFVENLLIAAGDEMCRLDILRKFVDAINDVLSCESTEDAQRDVGDECIVHPNRYASGASDDSNVAGKSSSDRIRSDKKKKEGEEEGEEGETAAENDEGPSDIISIFSICDGLRDDENFTEGREWRRLKRGFKALFRTMK